MRIEKIRHESIDEILATPVKKIRKDQIDFLQKILKVNEDRKKSFWHKIFSSFALVATFVTSMTLCTTGIIAVAVPTLFVGCGLMCFEGLWFNKAINMVDYSTIGTNKWSFDSFLDENGIEKVSEKYEECLTYEAEQILNSINYEKNSNTQVCSKSTETTTETTQENLF